MQVIHEQPRDVPVAADCDICVVGGSCTGVFAAVNAARLGARVALIEDQGLLGGTATAGLVCVWHSLFDTEHNERIIAGRTQEVLDRLATRNAVRLHSRDEHKYSDFNPAELAIELDELVREAGVRVFLHARFVAPVAEGGRMTAAILEDKSRRRAVRAACFIDATGDGDVIARLGLPVRLLDDVQPPTTCAVIRGIEEIRRRNPGFDLSTAVFDPKFPNALPEGFLWWAVMVGAPDEWMVAGTRVRGANCADADELTRAEIEGRRQVRDMCDILRKGFEGGDAIVLRCLAAHIGVRETRHAVCLHQLTESEVLLGTRFDDAIANGSYRVDVHHSGRPGLTFRYLDGREVYVRPGAPRVERRWRPETTANPTFYQIPYRSLVPQGSTNVLVAGRLTDADRGAYGAVRVMVNCNQTGEAAGAAAYLALNADIPVADVDPAQLRATLRERGSIIL